MRDPLERISQLHDLSAEVDRALRLAIEQARESGHSWAAIGRAMGMSKQSAWERFGRERRQAQPKVPHRNKGRQS